MTTPEQPPYSCDEATPLLPLVADQSLTQADDPALFDHLALCPRCQEALVHHDLISLALAETPATRPPQPRIVRSGWWWALPMAAAAGLAVTVVLHHEPRTPTATAPVAVAPATPPAAEPITIEREVSAVPSGLPGKRLILVRRGDQVMLVDPAAAEEPVRTDTAPASLRY